VHEFEVVGCDGHGGVAWRVDAAEGEEGEVLFGGAVVDGGAGVEQFEVVGSAVEHVVLPAGFAVLYEGILHWFYLSTKYNVIDRLINQLNLSI
jgi:hypothetical protein